MKLAALSLSLVLITAPALAGGWNPDGWEQRPTAEREGRTHPAALAADALLGFYRDYLSPIDAPRCPTYPTCSTYAAAALKKHGPLGGLALTSARLVSEADEAAFSRWVYVGGEPKVWWPVEDSVLMRDVR